MDQLWAPWRRQYITSQKQKRCIFCRGVRRPASDPNIVFEGKFSLVLLNIYPYNNGHLMVAPKKHVKDISDLSSAELSDLFKTLLKAKALLDKTLKPEGYNIGLNISSFAGAGIPGHIHLHIVPRWQGDTNFMPVVSGTKVISQSLKSLRRQLKSALRSKK